MKKIIIVTLILILSEIYVFSQQGIYNVKDFGAIGNGKTLCTAEFQNTINACADNGGGKVIVPPGSYQTGPLFLKSDITFEVLPGAVLIFDDNIENCPVVDGRWEGIERKVYASLFTGHDLKNITITGRGTLDGQGEAWWEAHYKNKKLRKEYGLKGREPDNPKDSPLKVPRPRIINLYNCTNVLISDLTIINSPAWTIHPVYCENVLVEGISIIQPYESPNTDGINPESCKNVRIFNCFVDCGDDCITIKSGYNEDGRRVGKSCENIVISNCTFAHGRSAVGIGSEMSGDVRNVTVSNCVFNGTLRGIRIKTARGRGGVVENYRADNIIMNNVKTAISIDMHYGESDTTSYPVTQETPFFKNIHLTNITAVEVENSLEIAGLPEAPIDGISISNSNFDAKNGFEVSFVKDLNIRDVKVNCLDGNALKINQGNNIVIDNFGTDTPVEDKAVIELNKTKKVFIYNCMVKEGTEWFLNSIKSSDLKIENNWLRNARVIK